MTQLSRRAIGRMTAGALAAPAIMRYAHAAEITWRLGHSASATSPFHKLLTDASEAISKRSDGKMELAVVGEGRLGIPGGMLAQVRAGTLDMTVATYSQLASNTPLCTIPAIGFLFGTYAKVWSSMDGALGQTIRAQAATELGVELLEKTWDVGFREITSSTQQIRTAADMIGQKIRSHIDSEQLEMFRSLGSVPIVVSLQNLRKALEHHEIEGQEDLLQLVEYARLNEVQRYCAMTRHHWEGLLLCISRNAWKTLPEKMQRIVSNTFNGTAPRQREEIVKLEETIRTSLTKKGMTFTEVDQASFREILRRDGYYRRLRDRLGAQTWTAIEQATGVSA